MKKTIATLMLTALAAGSLFAQLRPNNQDGLNMFETPKQENYCSDFKVTVGGNFTQSFQSLSLTSDNQASLYEIYPGFNNAVANLVTRAYLAEGVTLNLDIYLSSRHHQETWVKGGYIQLDRLPFIKLDAIDNIMKYATLKVGHMEINYGDAHFRRSDNGNAFFNPFIENNIMDAFDTEIGAELNGNFKGFVGMVGVSGGKIKADILTPDLKPSVYAKLGYDKQLNEDLRVRLTGSLYKGNMTGNLFSGDRAGSHYYSVMLDKVANATTTVIWKNGAATSKTAMDGTANHTSGRYNPGMKGDYLATCANLFIKYKGLESFTTIEGTSDTTSTVKPAMQIASDLVYRFGSREQFWAGVKYNTVSQGDISINRLAGSLGWYVTKNVMAKAEYVNQDYKGYTSGVLQGGNFKGFVIEGVVAF